MDDIERTKERLQQSENLRRLKKLPSLNEFLIVAMVEKTSDHFFYIDTELVPDKLVETCLTKSTIEELPERMVPGANRYHNKDGTFEVVYWRFGNDDGFEPLVLERSFNNLHPDYYEISEEFRYFHNLYHDVKTNEFFKLDDAGNDQLVAMIKDDRVLIRMREIRQFLAIKEMHLAVQFDYRENSKYELKGQLGLDYEAPVLQRDGLCCWDFTYDDVGMENFRGFSRLLGKIFVPPLPKEKSGIRGFGKEEEEYAAFIINVDENGDEIKCTGEPQDMGAHPLKPDYLTQVDFKRTVLDKYYEQASKYSVEDGYLRCGSLWGLMMDNHHKDKVSVWLGDLGRDLPYSEQLHWKAHNIAPVGGISGTFLRRQILAKFANSDTVEHRFHEAYRSLQDTGAKKLGWCILVPPVSGDLHHLSGLRVPATNEQKTFDEQVLNLTKILIDYLNEKKLQTLVDRTGPDLKAGGINLLERVCNSQKIKTDSNISFLRELQQLRSKGSAHRKGSDYQKVVAASGAATSNLAGVFERFLERGIEYLKFLESGIINGGFVKEPAPTQVKTSDP